MNKISMEKTIEMKKISKTYDGKHNVLEDLDLIIHQGEYVVIKGKSGSGKSTLLNIMGLLDKHTDGYFSFLNKEVRLNTTEKYDIMRGENIGFIFQAYNLIEYYTVKDNILMPYLYNNKRITSKLLEEVEQLLDELEIAEFKNKPVEVLSGGQKQRCAIARAIAEKPRLIIADEPTGNLDMENAAIISRQFRKLADNNTTVIVVTHNDSLFNDADTFYELRDGKVYKNNAV